MNRLSLALKLARREMRSGLSGFRIFLASLVLGVAAIASVGSLSQAFLTGLAEQGRVLLGGDVSVGLVHRQTTPAEHALLEKYGRVSETISLRGMAYALKNGREEDRQLVELKAVDGLYPLYGSAGLSPNIDLADALKCAANICGATAEQTLLDRLHLSRGGVIRIGKQNFRISAVLANEPDRISGGFSLGPHVMISDAGLNRTGLITLGSLIQYSYRVAMPSSRTPAQFRAEAMEAFPDAGWEIRDRANATPGTSNFISQITMFLTLVGLTALAVGGVGAGQAISAFLDRKRNEIAILKSLGADGQLIFLAFFLQVMAIATLAVVIGLAAGATLPFLFAQFLAGKLPIPADYKIYPLPLALAAVFGLLSAAAFGIPPLARAREIQPASLFRDLVARANARGRWPYLLAAAVAGALIVALAFALAPAPIFALEFLGGIAAGLAILRIVGEALRLLLKALPHPRRSGLRLALANLIRPGAHTVAVVTALGLGLTLLATVALLDRTISAQVQNDLPDTAPSFFFIDIQPGEAQDFDRAVTRFRSAEDYKRTPMIRGRIVALNGVPARSAEIDNDAKWAVSGDRGITYAAVPPPGTDIVQGKWWPANYSGPTLISFDADLAQGMHLKIGDTITLNVLGRELTGRIFNLRNVNFASGRQNFVLILSPGIIDKAPHSFLATVRVDPRDEESVYRSITDRFPNVSAVRVKDAIAQVNSLLQELALGVRAASLLTIFAGLLVLAGAISAGQRARLYDSTVLKVLGMTRSQIACIYAMEYGLLGVVTGALALVTGTLAASIVTKQVFGVPFVFDSEAALLTVLGGGAVTLAMGLIGAWVALAAKPSTQLRNP
ncbi:MAG TPA: FtsX-like permease family protein [Rhizomicrobium sp.]|nr:FtsX-like permease family protein [Rhizomicrobium sp.]